MTTEKNDCSVRALATACGMSYESAHDHLRSFGRKDRHSTPRFVSDAAFKALGLQYTTMNRSITVRRFLASHRNFTGILNIRNHHSGVLNGVVTNDWLRLNSRSIVIGVWTKDKFVLTSSNYCYVNPQVSAEDKKREFEVLASHYGLTSDHFGAIIYHKKTAYRIVGIRTNSYKNIVELERLKDRKIFVCPVAFVKQCER